MINNGTNNENNPWANPSDEIDKPGSNNGNVENSADFLSMLSLLGETSSTQGGRIIPEIDLVKQELEKQYESQRKNTINKMTSRMAPSTADISVNVSPVLPGIVLFLRMGNTLYISPFLFYNRNIVLDIDEVQYYIGSTNLRQNSPRVPASYINKHLFNSLENELRNRHGQDVKIINIGGEVINMDSIIDVKDQEQMVKRIKDVMILSWETSFMTQLLRAAAENDKVDHISRTQLTGDIKLRLVDINSNNTAGFGHHSTNHSR